MQSGVDEKAREAAIASAVAQARQQLIKAQSPEERDATVVPHELGHKWFKNAFWPGVEGIEQSHYGGPAPDWMDELAAVILEPDASKSQRRAQFWSRYHSIKAKTTDRNHADHRLLDLAAFLQSDHPMKSVTARISKEAAETGVSGFRVMVGDDTGASQNAALFYLQSLLVADFLEEASGNRAIFAEIARSLTKGQTFGKWLAVEGAAHRLPTSENAFVGAWLDWLDRKARLRPPMKDASATG